MAELSPTEKDELKQKMLYTGPRLLCQSCGVFFNRADLCCPVCALRKEMLESVLLVAATNSMDPGDGPAQEPDQKSEKKESQGKRKY